MQTKLGSTRRRFLARTTALTASVWSGLASITSNAATSVTVAEAFDREMQQFMKARNVPGGALAVVKDLRLVYTRGYGWADVEKKEPVRPESLFRIASVSKPFTAAGILKLVESGRLDLEARAFDILRLPPVLAPRKWPDARLRHVTIRHLLHHTGGWDRDKSGDPMFQSSEIASAVGGPAPATPEEIIRYMLGRPLDFDSGSRYSYSNFGYCVLGRIIEKISGAGYEQFTRQKVLAPIGIERMRLGRTPEDARVGGEVKYYMPDRAQSSSVFPDVTGNVPVPYGGFCLESMDSHGGWLASAVDLARFAAALDDPKRDHWLKPKTRQILVEPPAPPASRRPNGALGNAFYGCGWMVRRLGGDGQANYWHNGSLPGTSTLLVRRFDGLSWAVLFNQRSNDPKKPDGAIDPALHRAANAVTEWPGYNLFQEGRPA